MPFAFAMRTHANPRLEATNVSHRTVATIAQVRSAYGGSLHVSLKRWGLSPIFAKETVLLSVTALLPRSFPVSLSGTPPSFSPSFSLSHYSHAAPRTAGVRHKQPTALCVPPLATTSGSDRQPWGKRWASSLWTQRRCLAAHSVVLAPPTTAPFLMMSSIAAKASHMEKDSLTKGHTPHQSSFFFFFAFCFFPSLRIYAFQWARYAISFHLV